MADSRRLAVLKDVQAALRAMTVAGGYHWDVTAAAVSLDPTTNLLAAPGSDGPQFVVEATPDGARQFFPAEQLLETIRLNITARVDVEDLSDPTARVTALENLAADLEKSLEADTTRSGLATDTRVQSPAAFVGVGSAIVVLVQPVVIKVYRQYGAP